VAAQASAQAAVAEGVAVTRAQRLPDRAELPPWQSPAGCALLSSPAAASVIHKHRHRYENLRDSAGERSISVHYSDQMIARRRIQIDLIEHRRYCRQIDADVERYRLRF
jgi:hypothetical protein